MKIKPLHDRVIVKRNDAEQKTASGIIIPDTAKEKPQEGKVIAVGTGIRKEDGTVLHTGDERARLGVLSRWLSRSDSSC